MRPVYICSLILALFMMSCLSEEQIDEDNFCDLSSSDFIELSLNENSISFTQKTPNTDITTNGFVSSTRQLLAERWVSCSDFRVLNIEINGYTLEDFEKLSSVPQDDFILSYRPDGRNIEARYSSEFSQNAFLTIDGFSETNVLTGRFGGDLKLISDTSATISIKDGSFEIQIIPF